MDGDHGPVIFAANHHSHVDTPVLLTAIPDTWRHKLFVGGAADYFFRTRLTSVLSALAIGAIPVERTRVSRRSADRLAELIDAGWSMLIFPEGGRSPDGWGQPFHGGAVYLALRCGVPVVPIHLHGTGRILRKGKRWPTPATATVTFGAPLVPEPATTPAACPPPSSGPWRRWPTRPRLTGGRPGAGPTPPLARATGLSAPAWRRTWALGDGSGRRRRQRRRWPEV